MSLATVLTIMGRIESATTESPIAVFRSEAPGQLDAHFASTVNAERRINEGVGLIGVFNSSMDPVKVKLTLQRASR